MRTRRIDQVYERARRTQTLFQDGAIRAGLANGSLVRGETRRLARGWRLVPLQGQLLPPEGLAVEPPLRRGQVAVAWEVIERPVDDGDGWSAVVVGVREA